MRLPQWLKWLGWGLATLILLVGLGVWLVYVWLHPAFELEGPVVYTQRQGKDLTFEILRPRRPNGVGVQVMISGSWKSRRDSVQNLIVAPLLRRGYTAFMVMHGSQPEFTVMEIIEDVQRATRTIRHRAQEFKVDPDHLGVVGGSSGGHLSLMLATRGGPGDPDAADPVERVSSAVQAVACFFPVTDLLNLGQSTENPGDGGPPKSFVKAFGPDSTNMAVWKIIGRDTSPIYHITTNLPPVLIVHGDADTLTPLEQSEWFAARAAELGQTVRIEVRPGKKHGWPLMILEVRLFAQWFDRWLRPQAG
jgi:acetyl esterase/lipase